MGFDNRSARKISRRNFLRTVGLTGAGLIAASCAQAPASPEVIRETVEVPVKETVVVAPTEAPAPEEIAYIKFLLGEFDPNAVAAARRSIQEFERKNPDIRLELQWVGPELLFEKVVAALTSGVGALDVIINPDAEIAMLLAAKGYLVPIDDVVEALGGDDFFMPYSLLVWEGTRYAMPYASETYALWYRKDLFEADDIAVPTTWEELEAAVRHFTRKFNPDSPTEFGITLPLGTNKCTTWMAKPFLWSNGAEFFDKDLNLVIDSDETVEFLEWYSGMFQYTSDQASSYSWGEMITTFLSEQSAITLYGGRVLGRLYQDAPHLLGKVGVFMYPKRKLRATWDDKNYIIIAAPTPYPEQCKRWLEHWVTGQPAFDYLCSVPSHFGPSTDEHWQWWDQEVTGCKVVDENPDIKAAFSEILRSGWIYCPFVDSGGVIEAVKQGKETIVHTGALNPVYSTCMGVEQPLATMVQNVVLSKMSPRDALKAVLPDLEDAVKRTKEEVGL